MNPTFDDRGSRSRSLKSLLDNVVFNLSKNAETNASSTSGLELNLLASEIKALNKLHKMGVVTQDHVDFVTVGIESTRNSIQRCQRGLPLELENINVKGIKGGMLVVKPVG